LTATSAIIPASGLGKRLSSRSDKAFVPIAGKPLLAHTLSAFQDSPEIDEIVLVVRRAHVAAARSLVQEYGFPKVSAIVPGGAERQDSVRNGLAALSRSCEIVAIHDAARPLVTREIIAATIEAAAADGAAIAAVPVIDTIKTSQGGRFVDSTPDRRQLYAVQTPQTFQRKIIECAFERAHADNYVGTDDASLVERLGIPVRIVMGSYQNLKVTTPADIAILEALMEKPKPKSALPRVGHGYDIHRFAPGRKLFLGGVEFPGEQGLLGHSDADVLLHAVADAVLGAAGAGDIGRLFPDTDPAYKDARSTVLLARAAEVVAELGWQVGNVDVTLIAERPRIARHVPRMQEIIAEALGIGAEQVSVKATTAEQLGAIGEGHGIECHAVAMIYPANADAGSCL
jgi:2-C-methyl-D-erythritol 4-phosphate cytidylyltransferase / 2-C-methyl-D-erythritol 2,4-cyclodiphosphate synthase